MSSGAGPANLIFPSGIDIFSTKVDRNVSIGGEAHTIPSSPLYQFFLDYVPLQNSPTTTSIAGFVEVSGTPSTFQFQTTYSGINAGLITFNALQSGISVNVTYKTFGDTIAAEFVNSLQSGLTNVERFVLDNIASGNFVHTSGDTMSGTLVMQGDLQLAGGNITSQASGSNTVGSISVPMADIFANNVTTYNVKSFSPLNLLATGGDLTASGDSVHIQSSTDVIDFQGNILPTTSGNKNIGSASLAWGTAYIDKLGKNLILVSGINFLSEISGSNTFGSALSPIGAIYADNIFSPSLIANLSGAFVHTSGDTMTGSLNIASGSYLQTFILQNLAGDLTLLALNNVIISGNAVPMASGTMDLGSPTNPWDTIYVKNIDGGVISGNFVLKTGDTMTGDLTLPVGTNLQVYSITSAPSSPSGTINITASQLNMDVASNIRFSTFNNQKLEIGLSDIFTSTNIIPTSSGSVTLGDSTRPFRAVYADNFYFLNNISGTVLTDVTFSGNIALADGTNLSPASGATVVLGSSGNPISVIYANTIFTSATSGTFVSKFGDTMYGDLVMDSGSNVLTSTSGTGTIGALGVPFQTVYADDVISQGLDDRYVNITGDTMTGDLVIASGAGLVTNSVSGDFLDIQGQQVDITSNNGPIIIDGNTEVQILVNGVPKLAASPSGTIVYDNLVPNASGTMDVGTPSAPFGFVYADHIILTGSATSGTFVSKFGDSMSGNLTMISGANILTSSSGSSNVGSAPNPFNNIFANDLLISGTTSIQNIFVHKNGDTMTGNLHFSSGKAIFMDGGTGSSEWVDDSIRLTQISSVGAGVNIVDTNGAGGTIGLTAVNNSVPGPSGLKGRITFNAGADDSSTIIFSGNVIKLNGVYDVVNSNSGVNNLGSSAHPFNGIYGNNLRAITSIIIPSTPPASGTAVGTAGQIIMGTDGYFYGCSGTNLWGRIQLSSF